MAWHSGIQEWHFGGGLNPWHVLAIVKAPPNRKGEADYFATFN